MNVCHFCNKKKKNLKCLKVLPYFTYLILIGQNSLATVSYFFIAEHIYKKHTFDLQA